MSALGSVRRDRERQRGQRGSSVGSLEARLVCWQQGWFLGSRISMLAAGSVCRQHVLAIGTSSPQQYWSETERQQRQQETEMQHDQQRKSRFRFGHLARGWFVRTERPVCRDKDTAGPAASQLDPTILQKVWSISSRFWLIRLRASVHRQQVGHFK